MTGINKHLCVSLFLFYFIFSFVVLVAKHSGSQMLDKHYQWGAVSPAPNFCLTENNDNWLCLLMFLEHFLFCLNFLLFFLNTSINQVFIYICFEWNGTVPIIISGKREVVCGHPARWTDLQRQNSWLHFWVTVFFRYLSMYISIFCIKYLQFLNDINM
jgi:hypothetical protein